MDGSIEVQTFDSLVLRGTAKGMEHVKWREEEEEKGEGMC